MKEHPVTSLASRVILEICGPVTQAEIAAAASRLMDAISAPRESKHLLKMIFVEMAQNVLKHSQNSAAHPAAISISDTGKCFIIHSRNAASPAAASRVAEIVSDTGPLTRTGLIRVRRSELYKSRRMGCAGIGLIEIRRKTGAPLDCTIIPLSADEKIVEITATLRK